MKRVLSLLTVVAVVALGPKLTHADLIFSVDNLNIRPDATFKYVGTETSGSIGLQPGESYSGTVNADPVDVKMRWSGLDLDGVGGANDHVDFTLSGDALSGNTQFSGLGWGQGFGLGPGESLTFSIKDISASSDTPGTITFDGFTSGAIQGSDFGDGAYDLTVDLNGNSLSAVDSVGGGSTTATYQLANNSFTSPTLVFDNVVVGADGGTATVREFDFGFSFVNVPEPSAAVMFGLAFSILMTDRRRRS